MSLILLVVVGLPAAVALLSVVLPGSARWSARAAAAASGTGLVLTAILAVQVARAEAVTAVLTASGGSAVVGLYADRLTVVLLLLVLGVSTVVQTFAGRYLRGDDRAVWFAASAGLLTTATAAMVTAATLIGLAVGWTVAGVALCLLLGTYRQLPAAQVGVARTARTFLVGDAALWLAVAVAALRWGNLDLRQLGADAPRLAGDRTTVAVVACLLVIAAAARSAQLPFARWLPATLAAPTPVSALLHAGVVNAGGVLLVRTSPLFGASAVATYLAFTLGAATTVYGTVLMLAKPDVKGALAHSTMGQMGFMIMTCGIGAYAAAVFHLVAHGMYKATLFLGSGSAVGRQVRDRKAPPAPPSPSGPARVARLVVAGLGPVAALAAAARWLHPFSDGPTSAALLAFAAAAGAAASWGWLRRHPGPAGVAVAVVAIALAAPGYLLLVHTVTGFIAPSIADAGTATVSPWLLMAPAAVLVAAAALISSRRSGWLGELHRTLYALTISAGHVSDLTWPLRRARATRSPAGWPTSLTEDARRVEGTRL